MLVDLLYFIQLFGDIIYDKNFIYIRLVCFSIPKVADKTAGYLVWQHLLRTSAHWIGFRHAISFRNVATCHSLPCTPEKMSLLLSTFYKLHVVAILVGFILNTPFHISIYTQTHTEDLPRYVCYPGNSCIHGVKSVYVCACYPHST